MSKNIVEHCVTCGTGDHIHIPWTPANVARSIGNAVCVIAALPITLLLLLLPTFRIFAPFVLTRRCGACGGLFLKGWIYRSVKGECPKCRYDLTGNVSGRCPECGYKPDPRVLHSDNNPP